LEYRNLGNSGLQVSIVGLGCNNFGRRCDADATAAIVNKALDLGVTLFDTADVYGPRGLSEEYLGLALKGKRQAVIVATKFASPMGEGPFMAGGSRRYIINAVEASLKRLGTDYIDLYQIHRPDPKTPIEETMRALDDLVRSGKVRYIGHSNFSGWQTAQAHYIAKAEHLTPFISAQNQYNLLERGVEADLVPSCKEFGVSILPFFPLASGFLTGKYRKGEPMPEGARLTAMGPAAERMLNDRNWQTLQGLSEFAEARGHTMLDLAIGWLASLPYVGSVISGATKPEQVEQNVAAGEWHLTADELAEVDKIARRR
jgi:aryl-alcohol dehydrogenase-like predicted oxidoreductase